MDQYVSKVHAYIGICGQTCISYINSIKKNMMFKKKTLVKYLVKKYDKNNI